MVIIRIALSRNNSNNYYAETDAPLNEWTHVAVVVDRSSGELRMYKNGILTNTHVAPTYNLSAADPVYIGWHGFNISDRWFGGAIDEVRISDVPLQPSEFIGYPFVEPPKYVVFDTNRDGDYEIYRMDEDGSNLVNLTNDPGNDYMPSASPDGALITFSSDRDGDQDFYTMDFYGGTVN